MAVPTQENQAQEQKPSDKELNFRKLEQRLQQEQLARQQAEERAAAAERLAQEKAARRNDDEDDDNDDEPYVDKRKLAKKFDKFEKSIEQKIDQRAEAKAAALLEQERKSNFFKENPDFEQVMGSDIVQKFADSHPYLAKTILNMPEGFERQKLVYENIKALGMNRPQAKEPSVQEKIDANRRSPYYQPSGPGAAPYASMGDFSQSGQKNAYAKMQELKNRLRI